MTTLDTSKPRLFPAGSIVFTPGAIETFDIVFMADCILRHIAGEWGDLDSYDWKANTRAVKTGDRILSAYRVNELHPRKRFEAVLWIITEADRSVTTLLLPDEY